MEHMYLVTDEMPEVVAYNKERGHELPHIIDFKSEIYMRQERSGMVLGTYEQACVPWSPQEHAVGASAANCCSPTSTGSRPTSSLATSISRRSPMPASSASSTGPSPSRRTATRSSGPVQGVQNFWLACGVMAGFSQGGGVGLALSQWMVNGDPGFDVWAMDCARFGEWATRTYTNEKVRENYSRRFSIRFPNEELPAARPQQTTALYDIMLAQGAVMGD